MVGVIFVKYILLAIIAKWKAPYSFFLHKCDIGYQEIKPLLSLLIYRLFCHTVKASWYGTVVFLIIIYFVLVITI